MCRPLGIDPRRVGSGRTGGTNVYRAAGPLAGILTVLGDVLKGALAVWLAARLVPGELNALAMAAAALAAIVGHNWSIYIGFKGGAGSTANIGAFLALSPSVWWFAAAALIACAVWYLVRVAAIASLTLSALILAACLAFVLRGDRSPAILLYGFGQLAIVAWALRPNIARLLRGEERSVDRLAPAAGAEAGEADG